MLPFLSCFMVRTDVVGPCKLISSLVPGLIVSWGMFVWFCFWQKALVWLQPKSSSPNSKVLSWICFISNVCSMMECGAATFRFGEEPAFEIRIARNNPKFMNKRWVVNSQINSDVQEVDFVLLLKIIFVHGAMQFPWLIVIAQEEKLRERRSTGNTLISATFVALNYRWLRRSQNAGYGFFLQTGSPAGAVYVVFVHSFCRFERRDSEEGIWKRLPQLSQPGGLCIKHRNDDMVFVSTCW